MSRSCWLIVALSLALALALVACRRQEPLRIGFLGGITGRVADLGVGGRNGAMLAVEECNAQGGINGRPVELVVRDDEQQPELAKKRYQELVEQRVVAVIGPMTSSVAMAVAPLADAARLVLLSPTVTTTQLVGKDDYFLRVISTTADYAEKNARYLYERRGCRSVAAVYEEGNASYTYDWFQNFEKTFTALGGTIRMVKGYRSGNQDGLQPLARELAAGRPDAVLLLTNAVDAALLCQHLRQIAPPDLTISMCEWASTERFIELGGNAVEGVYVSQYLDRGDTSPAYREFRQRFLARFGLEPGFPGLTGYDATKLLLDALAKPGAASDLKQTLLQTGTFQGVQQSIRIDADGDSERATFISVVRAGTFVKLE